VTLKGMLQLRPGLAAVLAAFVLTSCAHVPAHEKEDAQAMLARTCSVGSDVSSAHGAVWIRARSKEESGQFPAQVRATAPSSLRLEVTNLVGGLEAVISVQDGRYTIEVPGKKSRAESGTGSWGGIPLRWATDLFLGRIPCPTQTELKSARVSTLDGKLEVRVPAGLASGEQVFVYGYRNYAGHIWPEKLHWEQKGSFGAAVDFVFDQPEDKTLSPLKWQARSDRGEVKTRWRDRSVD
jgi:hypothetical protein